jgi:hypothetical protein
MTSFDQRGQKVIYQFNAKGDINFGSIQNKAEFVTEMRKLISEVQLAAKAQPDFYSIFGSLKHNGLIRANLPTGRESDACLSRMEGMDKIASESIAGNEVKRG